MTSKHYGDSPLYWKEENPIKNLIVEGIIRDKLDEKPDNYDYDDTDQEVVGKDGGLKNDKDKPDWSLLPLDVIEGIVIVLMYGAEKYKKDNWKTVENKRNFSAILRHLTKWQKGEDLDEKSGLHHLDHALCDLMFMRWRIKNKKEVRL